jgi:AraC-like DNA-binding protein
MAAINSTWLNGLIAKVQQLSFDVVTTEQSEMTALVRRFANEIAAPPDPLHKALLSNILLDVCRHVFESFHASLSLNKCTCAAEGWSGMTRFARWYEDDPKESLTSWVDAFLNVYVRNHPPSVGTRAAERLRRDPTRECTVAALARTLGVTPKALGRDLRERFGIGVIEYLHAARVARAMTLIERPWKLEAIAYEVG